MRCATRGRTSAERERIAAAIRGLNHAHIETIHAFAASLLRERPVEALIDPGFEVLDELPSQLAFRAAWDEWITGEMAADPPPAALLAALNLGLPFRHVREAAERLHARRHALPLRPYDAPTGDADRVAEELRAATEELRGMKPRMKNVEDETFVAIPEFIELCEGLLAIRDDEGAFTRALATVNWPKHNGRQPNWMNANDCRATKAAMDRITDAVHEFVMALRSAATGDLLLLARGVRRVLRAAPEARRGRGLRRPADLGARPRARRGRRCAGTSSASTAASSSTSSRTPTRCRRR